MTQSLMLPVKEGSLLLHLIHNQQGKASPLTFTLYCLAYGRVLALAGTIFNIFGMMQKVSSSSELVMLTTPICDSLYTAPNYHDFNGHLSKLLKVCFQLSQRGQYYYLTVSSTILCQIEKLFLMLRTKHYILNVKQSTLFVLRKYY